MVDDDSFDGNDFLRLLELRGGVSCFYYTDPNELRNPSSDFTTLGPFVPKSAIKVGNAVAP